MNEPLTTDQEVFRAVRADSSFLHYYVVQVRKWWGWKTLDTAMDAEHAQKRLDFFRTQPRKIP